MKKKDLSEDILLEEVFPLLPPFYMDFTLPMVRRSYRRLVKANIAKLPKHSVCISNTTSLPDGSRCSRHHIGCFSFDCGRKWGCLTTELLKNLLANRRLGRILRVEIHESDASSEEFIKHLLTAAGSKVPVTTMAFVEAFIKHGYLLAKNLQPACVEWHRDPCLWPPPYSSQHYIFHFPLHLEKSYRYYIYATNLIFRGAHSQSMRLVYHFSHICYIMGGGMDGEKPSKYSCTHARRRVDEQNAAAQLVMHIIYRFEGLGDGEFYFPEDVLLFCDKNDSGGFCKKSMEIEWKKTRPTHKPIYRLEGPIAEEITDHDYYYRLEGCTWEVYWVSNLRLNSGNSDTGGGGGKCHLRVMRKVGGSDDVTLAIHFKVFDEAGKANWKNSTNSLN